MRIITENSLPLLRKLVERYNSYFTELKLASVVLSPVSIIILGDHTHYNDGISISAAVNRYTAIAVKKREDKAVQVVAGNQDTPINVFSEEFFEKIGSFELRFIRKLVHTLRDAGKLNTGFDCVIVSDIPRSVGLGVYTSLLIGTLNAININLKLEMSVTEIMEFSRKVELELIGKISNKAHHYTVSKGKKNRLVYFDLRHDEFTTHSLPESKYKIIICDSPNIIERIEDICNERITECDVGVKGLRLYIWGITNLRDVELNFLEKHVHMIPRRVFQRCLYNVKERMRVDKAMKALKKKDYGILGEQMFNSNESLSVEYNLSSEELDYLVEESKNIEGVLGSKMISCTPHRSTLNLVESQKAEQFISLLSDAYKKKFGKEITAHILEFGEGVKHIPYKELVLTL